VELYDGAEWINPKGVPSDWATHMIGHELTALYGIDHARTLAVVGPNLYRVMFETKRKIGTIRKTYFQFNWN
jgi:alcohol dehydrogenase YqhD (iron-dependent ADH family)